MIQETLVTTQNLAGTPHIAPMGIHIEADTLIILPFRPSTTLNNILETGTAIINYCDDVRIFAGCITGRRDWPLNTSTSGKGNVLQAALAHDEVELLRVEDDPTRPKLWCKLVQRCNHAPFTGFNRAQFAVLEAAILVSRLHWLPAEKIQQELDYLRIGFNKTAGDREREAWEWLMSVISQHQTGTFA